MELRFDNSEMKLTFSTLALLTTLILGPRAEAALLWSCQITASCATDTSFKCYVFYPSPD